MSSAMAIAWKVQEIHLTNRYISALWLQSPSLLILIIQMELDFPPVQSMTSNDCDKSLPSVSVLQIIRPS